MSELNEQQVALISAYIKQHGIAQNTLHDDLLDHVCTSIERQMDEGKSFEAAFEQTIKLFGPGGLKQVQQQTFELLTEMNENMKKVASFSIGIVLSIYTFLSIVALFLFGRNVNSDTNVLKNVNFEIS